MVEEATLHWLPDKVVPRQRLVDFLVTAALTMLPDALALDEP